MPLRDYCKRWKRSLAIFVVSILTIANAGAEGISSARPVMQASTLGIAPVLDG